MKTSESIKNISEALSNMHVSYNKSSVNPFYKSKYADLNTILQAISEPLAEAGLSVVQGGRPDGDGNIIVETFVSHTSGEWILTETYIPIMQKDPQKAGASITYGRRYALEAFFNMSAEDDDGNSASNKSTVKINFDSIEEQFQKCFSTDEVESLINKYKAQAGSLGWTPKQLDDVRKIAASHYKNLSEQVKEKFQGEEVNE